MVKTYLRYEQHASFGVISSANAIFDSKGKVAITASLEEISLWNIRQGVKTQSLRDPTIKARVTALALSPDSVALAAGYSDGTVRIWDYQIGSSVSATAGAGAPEGACRATLTGHRAEVTTLSFSKDGAVLVSGSMDTELIVWDVVAEKGLVRLPGHKDVVTCCYLIDEERKVISGSKDGMVKVWDLETQRCVQTLVGHHNHVWSLTVSPDHTTLVTGSVDNFLRVWKLGDTASEFVKTEEAADESSEENYAKFFGTLNRTPQYKDYVGTLAFNKDGSLLACQSSESTVDIFLVLDEDVARQKVSKRDKRRDKKKRHTEAKVGKAVKEEVKEEDDEGEEEGSEGYQPSDFFYLLETVSTTGKIKSFAFDVSAPTRQFMLSMGNNSVEVYKLGAETEDQVEAQKQGNKQPPATHLTSLTFEGHPADVRYVGLSYDDASILTVSNKCVKIFNTKTKKCIRTLDIEYGICGTFIPGDIHVVIGTKTGKLFVVELASGLVQEVEGAHTGVVWSVCVFPNGQGLASASADKTVKFWSFSLKDSRNLTLVATNSLDVQSEVTSVCVSPDCKHVAVALLDYTVQIFKMATLKHFLSLYGHKLPVLSISISSDSSLIATGSADKNFKIWGMDFGDCHKSIFAHDDSVTQVAFVPNTHYLFTTGKDKLVKYWDADKFEHVQTLRGHQAEVWGLAVNTSGRFVVTSSHDRSIRIWEQTDEQLFLEEERENELDNMFEASLLDERRVDPEDPTAPTGAELSRPSRATMESVKGSEKIMEALGFIKDPETTLAAAMLRGRTPEEYVFHVVTTLRASDVEEALLLLPYAQVGPLLRALDASATRCGLRSLETLCRTLFFLLGVHHKQLTLDNQLLPLLVGLNEKVKAGLRGYKRVIGVNRAAMGVLQREIENTQEGYQPLFQIAELRATAAKKRRRGKKTNAG